MQNLRRRFTVRFSLAAAALTVAAALGLGWLTFHSFRTGLLNVAAQRSLDLGNDAFTEIAPQGRADIEAGRQAGAVALRSGVARVQAMQRVRAAFRGALVVRFSAHDRDGWTFFSTDAEEIGSFAAGSTGFAAALRSEPATVQRHVAGFRDLDGAAADRQIVETWAPLKDRAGRVIGVMRVALDVTDYHISLQHRINRLMTIVGGTLFVLLGVLIVYVARERTLAQQQAQTRALSEKAEQAEAESRQKSRFLASMGHELKTPLNAIIGYSEAMTVRLFGPLGSAKYDDYARTILNSGRHLNAVLNDIMDMARIENGKLSLRESEFSAAAVIDDCAKLIAPEAARHGLSFEVAPVDGAPRLVADEAKIKQVLLNLLSNAVRYTPEGGRITLRTALQAGALRIEIADTGIGIPPDQIGAIFEPFRQADSPIVKSKGGLGLGLSIAKAIADLHGAALELRSTVGRGTVAALILPPSRVTVPPRIRLVA